MESRLFTNFAKEEVEKILSFMKKKILKRTLLFLKREMKEMNSLLIYKGED